MNWQTIVQQNNLEVSIVNLTEIESQTRIDPEYYQQEYLRTKKCLELKGVVPLFECCTKVTDGTHFTPKYIDTGKPFLSALNVLENKLSLNSYNYISEEEHNQLTKRAKTEPYDILLRKVGVGPRYAVVVPNNIFDCSIFVSLALLKLKTEYRYFVYFLSTFINSYYGQKQLLRFNKGISQPDLHLEDIRKFQVPLPSKHFANKIEELVVSANSKGDEAVNVFTQAEQLLLTDLNLADYIPSDINTSTRKISDCLEDDRFDAEYWQPKYDDITQAIKSYRSGFDTFDNLFVIGNQTAINPDETYSYVELADVDSSLGTIENYTDMQGKELPSRGRMPLRKDDVIMSSLDGSLNKTALVTIDKQNIIGSTGFFVLRKKYFEPEVALVLLKSKPIQEIVGRQAQGTILTAIPKTSLSRILLPKIAPDIQAKIKSLVIDAHKNKVLAQLTLEKAKRAVEIFVEQDEASALAYLN